MAGNKLAALALLVALLGCVACTCQASYGYPYPTGSSRSPPRPAAQDSVLNYDYYHKTCKGAEKIVRDVVKQEIRRNRGIGAGLIRLFFHDCFVQGCDGSVLLDKTNSSEQTEKFGVPNINSLRGFEVIDKIKRKLEAKCKGVVSCADIVAFAGRDSTFFLSNKKVDFEMPAGRYDGRVSRASETTDLPPPFANVTVLEAMFKTKGLSLDDMVTLSGAHTVGLSKCSSFADRLPRNASDPMSMNSRYAKLVTRKCRSGGSTTVNQDIYTPNTLDNKYYKNVLNHDVLLTSDATLESPNTKKLVKNNLIPYMWEGKFKRAMVKMGGIGVKTKANGEIRKNCRLIN